MAMEIPCTENLRVKFYQRMGKIAIVDLVDQLIAPIFARYIFYTHYTLRKIFIHINIIFTYAIPP